MPEKKEARMGVAERVWVTFTLVLSCASIFALTLWGLNLLADQSSQPTVTIIKEQP